MSKKKPAGVLLLRSKLREGPGVEKTSELKADVELQEHQKRLAEKLKHTDSILAYHTVGSGKSLSSIAATEGLGSREIVVPASLRPNYQKELKKFTQGKGPKTDILSYEAATAGKLKPADALILDESQRLGNSSTARSRAIIAAAPHYKKRILLSGTPIKNSPAELAPLSRVLNPGDHSLPLDPQEFKNRFIEERKIDPGFLRRYFLGAQPGIEEHAKNLDVIHKAFHGHVDYYKPSQEGYPERRNHVVDVPMTNEQTEIYNTLARQANPVIAQKVRDNFPLSKREQSQMNAFLTKTRIASNTAKPYGGTEESPKFRKIVGNIQKGLAKDPNHKSLIFSNYLEGGVDELAQMLAEQHISAGVFKGGLNDSERKQLVDDYNTNKLKVLLLSSAAAEGIDLKGTRSQHLVNPQWNLASTEQAIGRGIRYGSHKDLPEEDRNVEVNEYRSTIPRGILGRLLDSKPDTSVDQYLYNLSRKKQALNDQFLKVLQEEGSTPLPQPTPV